MKLAHISDLHIGKVKKKRHIELCKSLVKGNYDQILLTGDITDLGTINQWDKFKEYYDPIWDKLIMVPGNHDRVSNNIATQIMSQRVEVEIKKNVRFIKIDSTAPHNKIPFLCHGEINVLDEVDSILERDQDLYTVIMLHHHPLPLPEDGILERMVSLVASYTKELKLGTRLVEISKGRCDLILHGHRHTPSSFEFPGERNLTIYNAGCTPGVRRYRVFNTKKRVRPIWIEI